MVRESLFEPLAPEPLIEQNMKQVMVKTKDSQKDIENELCFAVAEKLREVLNFSAIIDDKGTTFSYGFMSKRGMMIHEMFIPKQEHVSKTRELDAITQQIYNKFCS